MTSASPTAASAENRRARAGSAASPRAASRASSGNTGSGSRLRRAPSANSTSGSAAATSTRAVTLPPPLPEGGDCGNGEERVCLEEEGRRIALHPASQALPLEPGEQRQLALDEFRLRECEQRRRQRARGGGERPGDRGPSAPQHLRKQDQPEGRAEEHPGRVLREQCGAEARAAAATRGAPRARQLEQTPERRDHGHRRDIRQQQRHLHKHAGCRQQQQGSAGTGRLVPEQSADAPRRTRGQREATDVKTCCGRRCSPHRRKTAP